jgi:hypothetical protein
LLLLVLLLLLLLLLLLHYYYYYYTTHSPTPLQALAEAAKTAADAIPPLLLEAIPCLSPEWVLDEAGAAYLAGNGWCSKGGSWARGGYHGDPRDPRVSDRFCITAQGVMYYGAVFSPRYLAADLEASGIHVPESVGGDSRILVAWAICMFLTEAGVTENQARGLDQPRRHDCTAVPVDTVRERTTADGVEHWSAKVAVDDYYAESNGGQNSVRKSRKRART